jgi:steroid 5-alpha reductase family enzyme
LCNEAHSFRFEERALWIVGGSSTEEEDQPSVVNDAANGGKKGSPQPTPTSFMKNTKSEESGDGTDEKVNPKAVKQSRRRRPNLRLGIGSSVLNKLKSQSSRLLAALGPLSMAFGQLFVRTKGNAFLTKPAIYALALLGSSSGFFLFLYFITIGYCCGVTLPVLVALIVHNLKVKVPVLTNVYCGLLVLWCARATWFFLYREYINWPQLHEKVIEVNKLSRPASKLFCWTVYTLFYVAMTTPFLCRLEGARLGSCTWKSFGIGAICLQAFGLTLETVADQQKMNFKSQPGNRNRWCNVGLWKYSTHPNYLGEQLFWVGSFLGGLSCYRTKQNLGVAVFGLLFISIVLSGARVSLGSKHLRKYGADVDFLDFTRTHSMWGPIPWRKPQDRQLYL